MDKKVKIHTKKTDDKTSVKTKVFKGTLGAVIVKK